MPEGKQSSEGWQRALDGRRSGRQRPRAIGRSVNRRAGLRGSKELFSSPGSINTNFGGGNIGANGRRKVPRKTSPPVRL
jgi:hypothetical protein